MSQYPYEPGHAPTDTSRAAAEHLKPTAAVIRDRVYMAIKARPMTSYEVAKAINEPYESAQPRTAELRAQGLIVDSGKRGPSRSSKLLAIVWQVAP